MSAVWLVARREIATRVRTRSFVLGTLAIIVVLALYVAAMLFVGGSGTRVGFVGQATAVAPQLRTIAGERGQDVEPREIAGQAEGEALVRDGELDALVVGAPDSLRLIVEERADPELKGALDSVVQRQALDAHLAESGQDPATVHAAVDSAHVLVTGLAPADPQLGQRLALAMAAGILLYMFLIFTGQQVAQGVVEEKSSRVVELLLSTIRPAQLLTGKVLGIGLTGLLQFAIITGVGLAAAGAAGALSVPTGSLVGTLCWTVAWFVLGYFSYATVLAAAASLVSRQEDLQGVLTPVIMLLVVPFVLAVTVLPGDPDSSAAAVMSLVPGFSPVLMPMRTALGVAAAWEIAVALAVTLAAIGVLLRVGGRIYGNAVLRTGARVRLAEALKA
ncbi:ABC transporter permease [Saccharopolyspora taberi]|uniref:ABC transporter permease n=1 Tax=Saccharopolyspora taberi TaxID=60895 RepID=A0ABN3V8G2_9PSEU